MGFRDNYNEVMQTLDEGGIGFGDFVKATGQYLISPFTWAYHKVTDVSSDFIASGLTFGKEVDDNVYIPSGTKTLLGEDFTNLYVSSEFRSYENSDGSISSYIVSTSPYATEMKSGNATANEPWSYDEASGPKVKAIYEITLLSKKYASQYQEGNVTANDKLSTEYADYMSRYRAVCEQQGISWNEVMTGVSAEMQTQCYYFTEESKDVLGASNADDNRVLVNRAHNMLKECMDENYEDTLLPSLVGKLSYEDTLDVESKDVGFFTNIGTKFSEFWSNLKDNWPHPFRAMKNAITGYVSNVVDIADSQDSEPLLSSESLVDTMNNVSDIKEDVKSEIKDIASDYGAKADEYLGDIIDSQNNQDDVNMEY